MKSQALKYGAVGVIGTLLHFALLYILVEAAGVGPVLASALGFIVVLLVSYALNSFWTFQSAVRGIGPFIKYTVVSVTGLLLNTGVMYAAVSLFHWHYLVGQCLVVLIVPCSNFVLNYFWTFRPKRPQTDR